MEIFMKISKFILPFIILGLNFPILAMENSNSTYDTQMISINSVEDVHPFVGAFVIYTSNGLYDDNSAFNIDPLYPTLRVGWVNTKFHKIEDEPGYHFASLSCWKTALVDSLIKRGNLKMRKATADEIKKIDKALDEKSIIIWW